MSGGDRWAKITAADLALTAELRPIEWRCWAALKMYVNDDGLCWPSIQTVADLIGVQRKQAQRGIAGLRDAGLVTRVGHPVYGANAWLLATLIPVAVRR